MDTIEKRWFFADPSRQLAQLEGRSESRTDWYAPIASPDSSVKWREGRLEAKFLAGDAGSGWQRWYKTSLKLHEAHGAPMQPLVEATWIPVHKERTVHAFRVDPSRGVEATRRYDGEVEVEWCRVSLPDRVVWTFCVESLASAGLEPAERVLLHLADLLGLPVAEFPPPQAYPAWLLRTSIHPP